SRSTSATRASASSCSSSASTTRTSCSRATGTATTNECILATEPVTMLTDYALGGVTVWLAVLLLRNKSASCRLWTLAFAALALAALHLLALDNPATRWILGGVAVSLIAAGIQAGRVALHEHFNHNDLYHVVQIVAMLLYYAGAKRMRDASVAP